MKVRVIGCGNINDIYLNNCQTFQNIKAAAVADLVLVQEIYVSSLK